MLGELIDRRSVLLWTGLLAAPLAWGLQHWAGIAVAFAACRPGGGGSSLPLHGVEAAIAVAAALLGAGGLAASIAAFRAMGGDGDLRESRMHFMATMGIAVSSLLVCIILLSGFGVSVMERCQQG